MNSKICQKNNDFLSFGEKFGKKPFKTIFQPPSRSSFQAKFLKFQENFRISPKTPIKISPQERIFDDFPSLYSIQNGKFFERILTSTKTTFKFALKA